MWTIILLGFVSSGFASDLSCTRDGGVCQDYRYYICTAGYETGKCDGHSYRRCCLECSAVCQTNENIYSQSDDSCTNDGGKCLHNSNYCAGSYYSGKCGGPSERQCCLSSGSGGSRSVLFSNFYGDIMACDTTGASCTTASKNNLMYCGVRASETMASTDNAAMDQYKTLIKKAAFRLKMDAAVIAGIISRESHAGKVLRSDGYGPDGHGYGLMQVDDRYHTLKGEPYSLEHIEQGTGILIDMINGVANNHRSWTDNMTLKGGISAYNAGVSNVQTYENMDVGTTGNDYANDVVARSQWYKNNGY